MLPVRTDEINIVEQVFMTTCKYIICVHFSICNTEMEKSANKKKDKTYVEVKHRKNLNVYIL